MDLKDRAAAIATLALLAAGLYLAYWRIDVWAETAFAQASLASMLVAVIDVAVLIVALCVAPPLSRLLRRALGRPAASP